MGLTLTGALLIALGDGICIRLAVNLIPPTVDLASYSVIPGLG